MSVSHVTTHVLDTGSGRPAAGISVTLHVLDGGRWVQIATGSTDADGRVKDLGPERLTSGTYRLGFDTGSYFAATETETFFPEVILTFGVDGDQAHYHVPLLLSPFAYSTYRGS
ncbi:5-hydroxyisourate hydrolase [Arthrobacter sp. V4I6]|uniref:hydroxyisourate hydrolase n=1 Tax=unclassified Arthrobacter TaxID=235627 RepID=UPI00278AB9E2|nr:MULTISPECIES: hydroxyisourate hydrolase [unclassified Arthrobacter]MDQ0821293.1 5-hydroxyisourate hydrolase [Arthrobacter sp. V1I7]MDQ0855557.1 5-hydroxyisourate hydrolase [Arthrobacter sp. V4I6]